MRVTVGGYTIRHAAAARLSDGASDRISAMGDSRAVVDRVALRELMWTHVGLERDAEGLAVASARLNSWRAPEVHDRRTAEDRNLLDLARLTVAAALARRESIGAHYRADAPGSARLSTPEQEAA